MKKYMNDLTAEEQTAERARYAVELAAWAARRDAYNAEATKATGLKHGDTVTYYAQGMGGMVVDEVEGKVIHDRNGYLVARFRGFGNRHLNKGMRKI